MQCVVSKKCFTGWVVGLRLYRESYGEGYSLETLLDGVKKLSGGRWFLSAVIDNA